MESDGSIEEGTPECAMHTKQSYIWKLDRRLIPILGCTYTILFLDRTNSELNRTIEGAKCR
jgi:hypothetical protein